MYLFSPKKITNLTKPKNKGRYIRRYVKFYRHYGNFCVNFILSRHLGDFGTLEVVDIETGSKSRYFKLINNLPVKVTRPGVREGVVQESYLRVCGYILV